MCATQTYKKYALLDKGAISNNWNCDAAFLGPLPWPWPLTGCMLKRYMNIHNIVIVCDWVPFRLFTPLGYSPVSKGVDV